MKLYNIVCLVSCFGLILANNIHIDIEEEFDDVIIPAMLIKPATLINRNVGDAIIPAMLIKPATLINRNVGDIWSNCTMSGDDAQILSVTIMPDPPQKGEDLTVTVVYNLKTTITNGTIYLHVKYSFFSSC